MKKTDSTYVIALIAILFWGTTAAVTKMMLTSLPVMENLMIASGLASITLLIINIVQGKLKLLKELSAKDYLIIIALGLIGIFLYTAFYNYGLSVMPASEASVVNYLWPMMIIVFSVPILHEKLTAAKVIAFVLSFAGIIIMITKLDFSNLASIQFGGVVACLAAAILYGLFSVINKKFSYDQGIAMMIYYIITFILSAIASLLTETMVPVSGTANILGILWLGIFGHALGYLLWNIALTKGNTAKISNLAYLTPFLALVFAKIILNEDISIFAVIGLLFIIGGIFLQLKADKK